MRFRKVWFWEIELAKLLRLCKVWVSENLNFRCEIMKLRLDLVCKPLQREL